MAPAAVLGPENAGSENTHLCHLTCKYFREIIQPMSYEEMVREWPVAEKQPREAGVELEMAGRREKAE